MNESKRNGKPSELASFACTFFEHLLDAEGRGWEVDCRADAGQTERWTVTIGYREEQRDVPGSLLLALGQWRPLLTMRFSVLPAGASLLQVSYCEDEKWWRYWDALRAEMERLGIPELLAPRARERQKPLQLAAGRAAVARLIMEEPWAQRRVWGTEADVVITVRQLGRARDTFAVDARATSRYLTLWGDAVGVITLTETAPGRTTAVCEIGMTADWWVPLGDWHGANPKGLVLGSSQVLYLWWRERADEWRFMLGDAAATERATERAAEAGAVDQGATAGESARRGASLIEDRPDWPDKLKALQAWEKAIARGTPQDVAAQLTPYSLSSLKAYRKRRDELARKSDKSGKDKDTFS